MSNPTTAPGIGYQAIGFTTQGMIDVAVALNEVGQNARIGVRTDQDHRFNVPVYIAASAADEEWLSYTDPEATSDENSIRRVSALRAGEAFNDICRMLGGRWPDAKLEQDAPIAHRFFMELLGVRAGGSHD